MAQATARTDASPLKHNARKFSMIRPAALDWWHYGADHSLGIFPKSSIYRINREYFPFQAVH
jgi:hypothetical protein